MVEVKKESKTETKLRRELVARKEWQGELC